MLKNIFVLLALSFLFTSCVVSKKKYEALLLEKNELADDLTTKNKENKELQSDLNQAIKDFEEIKTDFGKSNSLRSDEIADLMIKVTQLEDQSAELNQKLNETLGKFKAKEKAGYLAEEELKETLQTITALKRDTANLQYSIRMAKQRSQNLQQELSDTKSKLTDTNAKKFEISKALEAQTSEVKNLEQRLVKSQQNLTEISDAFIALRKELLSAKTSNNPIDPNKNKYIDRIAKLLGHY
ncbi:hypothetical protein [Carboxylicivirga caseinilyticus]|uniref:hypothetical protein n=1 Tax=Carboxylicivirga caseinilyticus TaxID=3417572 RepID=UPI003D3432C3|nr:hypothetical protein [Marinilabiliaceae bacterium A049]